MGKARTEICLAIFSGGVERIGGGDDGNFPMVLSVREKEVIGV